MKIIHSNLKHGIVKVKIENTEDLWYLSTIITQNDKVKGTTVRKIKTGTEEKSASYKTTITLIISVENTQYEPSSQTLRITGTVTDGPEEVQRGSHHTLSAEINDVITIEKERWMEFQLKKLKEASEIKQPNIIICIFDREEAFLAQMTRQGYKLLGHIKGDVAKKHSEHKPTGNFYQTIIQKIKEYDQRLQLDHIILASPSFWKEELLKTLGTDDIRKKIIQATVSSVDETAFNEVLKREEIHTALKQERTANELKLVDELLAEIKRNGNIVYGIPATSDAAEAGAIKILLITDGLITNAREEKKYFVIEKIMRTVDTMKGTITIIHSDNQAGKKLDGISGIAALIRYKL
ncbi:mRNA surveillance protein pelota [Candidatus Woesearchaeota archaeon]|nr:mRNA surveillance protein pelota [Candidatus Woesearchaeota archaeon]